MIKLSTYARLLVEGKFTQSWFEKAFADSLSQKLDVPVEVVKSAAALPPAPPFAHLSIGTKYFFVYHDMPLVVHVQLYHYKINPKSMENLSNEEWRNMLNQLKDAPFADTTTDMVTTQRNIQISIRANVLEKSDSSEVMDDTPQTIGFVKGLNIDEVTTKIKKLLQDQFGGDGNQLVDI